MIILQVGCGGSGSTAGTSSTAIGLSGTAAKGILKNAQVSAYEVVNGVVSSTPLGQTTTSNTGTYTLSLTPTSNPVIVEVKVITGTKMLDETQFENGDFKEVDAPSGLSMRSFTPTLTEASTVRINPLTEAAVAIAESAVDANNKPLGIKADSLRVAQQVVISDLSPVGVDPFMEEPPTSFLSASSNQKKMVAFMAGVMSNPSNVKQTISQLSDGIKIQLSTGDQNSVDLATRNKLNDLRQAKLVAAASIQGMPAELSSMVASATTEATSNRATSALSLNMAEIKATEGFKGFINSMRSGFAKAESTLESTANSLEKSYVNLAGDGVNAIDGAIGVLFQCDFNNNLLACSSNGDPTVTWTKQLDGTYKVKAQLGDRYLDGTVSGQIGSNSIRTITANGSLSTTEAGAPKLAELKNLTLSYPPSPQNGNPATGTVSAAGSVKVYDSKSSLSATLSLDNLKVDLKNDSMKLDGNIALSVSNGDSLTGSIQANITRLSVTDEYGTYIQEEPTNVTLALVAKNNNAQVLGLSLALARTLPPKTNEAITADNFGAASITVSLALPNSSKFEIEIKNAVYSTSTETLTITTAGNGFSISRSYTVPKGEETGECKWFNEVKRCAPNKATLSSADKIYTADLTESNGQISGDIKKGTTVVGKLKDGVLQINGGYVSLF